MCGDPRCILCELDEDRGKKASWVERRRKSGLLSETDEGKRVDRNLVKVGLTFRLLVSQAGALQGWNEWSSSADGETIRTGAGPEGEEGAKGKVDLP